MGPRLNQTRSELNSHYSDRLLEPRFDSIEMENALVGKIFAQHLGQPVRIGLRRHESQILAVPPHQVDDAGVVDRVIPALLVRYLHVERLVGVGDLSNFFWWTGKADKTVMKRGDVVRQQVGVPFRIDRDENRLGPLQGPTPGAHK